MTSDSMTSDSMASDSMASDSMTSDSMTSDSMTSDPYAVRLVHVDENHEDGFFLSVSSGSDDDLVMPLDVRSDAQTTTLLRHAMTIQKASFSRWRPSEIFARVVCTFQRSSDKSNGFLLRTQIIWRGGPLQPYGSAGVRYASLLRDCFLSSDSAPAMPWSPDTFYESVHVPPTDLEVMPAIQNNLLRCSLYPFQKRAVHWLLAREGAAYVNGRLIAKPRMDKLCDDLPPSFSRTTDARGRPCYVSPVLGVVVHNKRYLLNYLPDVRGGILAEEMGLGKTVELIALICLHKRQLNSPHTFDVHSQTTVTPSGSTLIITPQHILQQWINEIGMHAPHLRVFHYKGMSTFGKNKRNVSVEMLLGYDVVLTTYSVLAREIHWAEPPPNRNLRHAPRTERRRSPLVLISWWRVCLDEAQMVESTVSQTATVARLIPRVNAWSVTGTPLKKDAHDLLGLLVFLRYTPFAFRTVWERIDKETFKQIFSAIALRHSKDLVRHELRLPPQKRVVITTPFTAIEDQHYAQMIQEMCDECGLNTDGSPATENYDPDSPHVISAMRNWLHRLRQTCLHPQVGRKNKRALGRGNGQLRTVAEVLEMMIEQNMTGLRATEKDFVSNQLLRGHIIAYGKNDPERNEKALKIYQESLTQADGFVLERRREFEAEKQRLKTNENLLGGSSGSDNSASDDNSEESDAESKESDQARKVSTLRKALRSALEMQHCCNFFVASAYFLMKTDEDRVVKDSDEFLHLEKEETEYYDQAKLIRKELLNEVHLKADRAMRKIVLKTKEKTWRSLESIPELEAFGGIENRQILEKLDKLSALLDNQASQIEQWRANVIERLCKPLVDEDEGQETTGDEYEDSTKVQDEVFVYVTALRAIIADRSCTLTGMPNFRTDQEVQEAVRFAKSDEGHSPKLMLEVMDIREKHKPDLANGSLRSVIADFRALATSLQWQGTERANVELAIVERHLKEAQRISSAQMKLISDLEKEQELFHIAMNQRVEFYRQLQLISDMVAQYKDELDEELDLSALVRANRLEQESTSRLAQLRTKHRYLLHLRAESTNQDAARICVICQCPFELGVLTVCGHQYCKECIRMWYSRHRTCPVCKRHLDVMDFHEITYKPQELRAQEEQPHLPESPSQAESDRETPSNISAGSIYSDISSSIMDEIKAIDLDGSFGTKIDTLARHILWLRENDPGAKSIIFSQYRDFLSVLSDALTRFKIGHTSIGVAGGIEKFRQDASIECFLLDAKSDSSGLNLVNATHVFLCEPLINTAIELQAIARVHRIGQQRPTTVYMYLIRDTVEEAIYDISVSRRLAHISRGRDSSSSSTAVSRLPTPALQENMIDKANSLEMEQAPISNLLTKGKSGGEIVDKDDLWNCLFGKPRRESRALPEEVQRDFDRQVRADATEARRDAARASLLTP